MNDFFRRLQADREIDIQFWKKHPELRAQLVDDAYPDEAHFVYELLQNAEDAGAKTVEFELFDTHLVLTHDGTRPFSERDVEAITDVSKTGKGDGRETIGRFGIGFKSVFKYTESPRIFSGEFSFQIVDFVCPKLIPPRADLHGRTVFIFPFNSLKKTAREAYVEIGAGLEQLAESTLLFLRNLQCIRWMIGNVMGSVLRHEHSEEHIEVLKETANKGTTSAHWLRFMAPVEELQRFTAPVEGIERQKVAVAFELAPVGDLKAFDPIKPIDKQLKIVPAVPGKVSVFFPADKETSGLRFHLHAPFIPELSRASIKNSPENIPLFEQLAKLAAGALHRIKGLGLLTGEFLAVLPNTDEQLPERYRVIRTAIVREMKAQPLTPTQARGFAPAERLIQARLSMKELLSDEDLAFLLERDDGPTWAIGATQRNSNQDRFLSSLDIAQWDVDSLVEYLADFACDNADYFISPEPTVMHWLDLKPDEWHQLLYAILYRYCEDEDEYDRLRDAKIVRLASGGHTTAKDAYFAIGLIDAKDPFRWVSENVLAVGTRKPRQADARKFLTQLGVRVPVEADEIRVLLQTRYAATGEAPADRTYIADLKRFIDYVEKHPHEREMFKSACLFRVDSEQYEWASADDIYLDDPFKKTGLGAYHGALKPEDKKKWPLGSWYQTSTLNLSKLATFAEAVGCDSAFHALFLQTTCERNPKWNYLRGVAGSRGRSPIDADCSMSQVIYDLLRSKSVAFSRLVWVTMCTHGANHLQARYQKTEKDGSRVEASRLVHFLRTEEWIPLRDGRFVTPRQANREELVEGFAFDPGQTWIKEVYFGDEDYKKSAESLARAEKLAELQFESESAYQRALDFSKLPEDKQRQILDAAQLTERAEQEDFPERPVRNPDLRSQRAREQAAQTPEKQSEMRLRSISEGADLVKAEAKVFLRDQYTNQNGVMFCQVCKDELPFKLSTGEYYFEAVVISEALKKRHRQTYLALCPNDAAKFKHANEQKDEMLELLAMSAGQEVDVVLGGLAKTIRFTETHLADIRTCLEAEDADKTLAHQQQKESTETLSLPEPEPLTAPPPLQPVVPLLRLPVGSVIVPATFPEERKVKIIHIKRSSANE